MTGGWSGGPVEDKHWPVEVEVANAVKQRSGHYEKGNGLHED